MRLDEIQCCILRLKLKKLPAWTKRRQEIAQIYTEAFKDLPGLKTPLVQSYSNHIYHQYTLLVKDREKMQKHLKDNSVGTAVHYPIPLNLQPAFADLGLGAGAFPVSEAIAGQIFSIPVYPELTAEDVSYIIEKVKEGAKL
jgi:dTDP-4-amino-4,6-dideoxygalactose transaminase